MSNENSEFQEDVESVAGKEDVNFSEADELEQNDFTSFPQQNQNQKDDEVASSEDDEEEDEEDKALDSCNQSSNVQNEEIPVKNPAITDENVTSGDHRINKPYDSSYGGGSQQQSENTVNNNGPRRDAVGRFGRSKPPMTLSRPFTKTSSSRSPSPLPSTSLDDSRKKRKRITEGTKNVNRINIGPGHQIPGMPVFFLNRDAADNTYSAGTENPRLVYSPFLLSRARQKKQSDGKTKTFIESEADMSSFITKCATYWKNRPGWQPFSPEYAYKLLHYADYNPEKAINLMNDSQFSFKAVCDPPRRKYENKWKPKDKRGLLTMCPYPPPVTLRGYLSRRQHVHDYSVR